MQKRHRLSVQRLAQPQVRPTKKRPLAGPLDDDQHLMKLCNASVDRFPAGLMEGIRHALTCERALLPQPSYAKEKVNAGST